MNSMILSLAPLGGIATALPAMTLASRGACVADDAGVPAERRTFAREDDRTDEIERRERDGGYLLL